jgi:hypothetical protein
MGCRTWDDGYWNYSGGCLWCHDGNNYCRPDCYKSWIVRLKTECGPTGGWISNPRQFTLDELKKLDLGETKMLNQGCAPQTEDEKMSKIAGFGWPDNGEFEWGGRGDRCEHCNYIDQNGQAGYGKECWGDQSIINGGRPMVKRKAFLADTTQCCLENAKLGPDTVYTLDGKTCAPKSRNPASDMCQLTYRTSCADANIVNNDSCKALVSSNKTLHRELMLKYCNKNLTTANNVECANYCRDTNVGITGISSDCKKLALSKNCKQYSIPENDIDCTETKVLNLEKECRNLSILLNNLGSTDLVSCNEKSVADTKKECASLEIPIQVCSPAKIEATIAQNTLQGGVDDEKDIGAANANTGNKNTEIVAAALCGILGEDAGCPAPAPPQKVPEAPEVPSDELDTQTILLIVGLIVLMLLVAFSCSSGAIAVL